MLDSRFYPLQSFPPAQEKWLFVVSKYPVSRRTLSTSKRHDEGLFFYGAIERAETPQTAKHKKLSKVFPLFPHNAEQWAKNFGERGNPSGFGQTGKQKALEMWLAETETSLPVAYRNQKRAL